MTTDSRRPLIPLNGKAVSTEFPDHLAVGHGGKIHKGFQLDNGQRSQIPELSLDQGSSQACPQVDFTPKPKRFPLSSLYSLFGLDFALIGLGQALILGLLHQRLFLNGDGQVAVVIGLSLVLTVGSLFASGCYRRDSLIRFSGAISPLPVAIGMAALLIIAFMHFGVALTFPDLAVYRSVSRCFTIALLMTAVALPICTFNRACYFAMVRRHWFERRVLIVGTGIRAAYLRHLLNSDVHRLHSELLFVSEAILGGVPSAELKVEPDTSLDESKSLEELARAVGADEVVIAVDEKRGLLLEQLLRCKTNGIPVIEYDALIERETGRIDLRWLDLSWLVYTPGFEIQILDSFLKRVLDLSVSIVLLLIALPAVVVAMVAIKLEDGGPVFYRQKRVTRGGKEFWIYKLRSMSAQAEAKGAQWATKNDPRTTRVGRILRKSRIDEIPQLWNVLSGDMSLVGPRPERPQFVEQLSKELPIYNFRHGVKAGLTGWAQINYPYGASVEDAQAKLEYDLYYMKNYSVLRDISIILQTFRILIWNKDAR
jgi:sugar transferase (PEP-CTERM system associated)